MGGLLGRGVPPRGQGPRQVRHPLQCGGEKTRRKLALFSAIFLAGGFLISLPATYDFITFKAIRSSDTLRIRLDILFSVYLIFLVAMIVHYGLRAYRLMRGDSMATLEREESL